MSPSQRVHAVGSYGFGNFGDDLFVATVTDHSRSLWPGAVAKTFAPNSPSSTYSSRSVFGKGLRLASAALGMAWSDTIAVCGGSVLQDVQGIARLRVAALKSRRVEALGVSVGPFKSGDAEMRVANFLRQTERLVVRDQASVDRIKLLGLADKSRAILGGDLAALSDLITISPRRPGTLVICPSAAAGVSIPTVISQVRSALQAVGPDHTPITHVTLLALSANRSSNDLVYCERLATSLKDLAVETEVARYDQLGLQRTCQLLSTSSMVWSQRLHGGIVAYLSNVPFLIVGHHAKCADFGMDIGAEQQVIPPEGSWDDAVQRLTSGQLSPTLTPHEYRIRASAAYAVDLGTLP